MSALRSLLQRLIFWFADGPCVQLLTGERIPAGWIADCLPGGEAPAALSGQVQASSQPILTPNLRQCEPWRVAPVNVSPIPSAPPRLADSEPGTPATERCATTQKSPGAFIAPVADRA